MADRASVLNDPPEVLGGPELLHDLIDFQKSGEACAIDFTCIGERRQYSYRAVQACAASLVSQIEKLLATDRSGLAQSSTQHIVPILLPQSPGLYISQLAILLSGGAFCPINLDAPKERIRFVVGDVSANLIITTSEFKETVSWQNGPTVIIVDQFPTAPEEQELRIGRSREASSHELAYVMYTSGSSGVPKGVAISHLAVTQSLLAHEKLLPPFKRFLQFAAPSFDVSVFEIFFPLTRGCTLVGCDRSQLLNDLPGMINELDVDAAELTPTVVGSLLQKRSKAPKLKLLLTIGEMLTTPIVEEFGGSETKESMLYGMYGPTEAAIHCTIHPRMATSAKPGNIGVPFETVSVFVAAASSASDEAGRIKFLPTGELGELVLGGPQLAQGYLNREEQSKAAFINSQGKSYYRTGDKARFLIDGTIEILGRMSAGQVKLRGQRIELGEIEEAVYKHPGIKTVVAVVLGGVLIVFALTDDRMLRPGKITETCAKWLPKFMVPAEIVLLNSFPYLPSGKVDKRRLEADYQSNLEGNEDENDISATSTVRIVEETLRDLLGPFSRKTRLTAAGLDSLVAIRVASKLRASGFNLTTLSVLQADTLAELTRLCESAQPAPDEKLQSKSLPATGHVINSLNGSAEDVVHTMACTPLQSAMLSETAVHRKAYMNWVELDLLGISDADLVVLALENLAEHDSILRTGFAESKDADGFVQVVWKKLSSPQILKVTDFIYEFDPSKDLSLHRPLRIQIRNVGSSTKLLIHLHHALYDAWSLDLLLDDLDNLLMGQSPPSRPSFSNVVEAYLNGTLTIDASDSKEYWKDHLSDLDIRQVPNFYNAHSPVPGLAIANLETSISTSDVEHVAKSLYSSPQSLFQAAYALVLSSYLGTSDLCFGTVFSGRTLPIADVEDIVGPCLATLPVRVDIAASTTARDLVQDLNAINRKHLKHSALPLRNIKSACGVHPRQPLFDTLIIWQQTLHRYDYTRQHVSLIESVDNLEFNLTLEIIPGKGNVELKANYQQSLFPESQINLLLKQVEQLARAIVRDQSLSLDAAFDQLTNDVLSIENEHPQTVLRPGTLSSPVERIAWEDPDRPAIQFATSIEGVNIESQIATYSQLNARANQIGHNLLSEGVLPDDLVCICMEKSVDLYASILATAKVGTGYLPVTPDVPPERLRYILREAGVKVILAQSQSRPLLKLFYDVVIAYVDEIKFSELSFDNISRRSTLDNVSYCVFTSGSTGMPKGVLVTQGNLLSNLDVLDGLYPSTKEARLLQSCSQAFDVSVFEIFFTWKIGGCLCSAVKDVLFRDIENAIRALEVTHLSLTPTVAALVDPRNVPKVQFLVTAGEAVTQKVFNAWADKGLYQGYGPSETTNICTVKPKVSLHDSINNIGPPLKNTSAFVLSSRPDFALVPRGGEGEFCFGGLQVFRGYMDQNQNIGKIIEHPTFGRIYRSGDFGRLMPDGSLAFTGRKDDQVKIRGQRVELGEINNIMLRSKVVHDCVTIVMGGTAETSQRLVCFWTSELGTSSQVICLDPDRLALTSLYKALEAALPSYMIPSALIPISHLPSTSQGKIDKRQLTKLYEVLDVKYLDSTAHTSKPQSDHTWTDTERSIARALTQYTKIPFQELNPETSFYNLGIDSISAIPFSRILRESLRCQVDISEILKYPSIMRLGERVLDRGSVAEESYPGQELDVGFAKDFLISTTDHFRKAGRVVERIMPCTPLQEAMLSVAQSMSENLYSNMVVLNVSGSLERLKACWQKMAQRHEILRTCFVETDNPQYAYAQVVLKTFEPKFVLIDTPNDSSQIFGTSDIPQPPYGFGVVQSTGSVKLVLSMHHALYDGIALEVLYDEVEKLYHDQALLPAVSFVPFLEHMLSMKMEEADQFWGAMLKDCSPTRLQRINSKPPNRSSIHRRCATSSLSWIEERTKKYSTSLLAVCHAVWAALISERFQESDVCFGNVASGRTVPIEGIERLVAPCFNTIPTRLQGLQNLTYLESFRKIQTLNAESLPFQLTPLRRIQSKFSPDGLRLFDTLFILQQPSRDLDSSIWTTLEDNGAMDFPLVCEVAPKGSEDALEIILHSDSSFITTDDATTLINAFDTRLQAALENPRRQLLSSIVKEQIISKSMNLEVTTTSSKVSSSSKSMTPEELKVREVVSSFTDIPVDKITQDVSIFRLGLDSISAVQVAARLRKQGHNVVASDVLEHSTISRLSTHLAQVSAKPREEERVYDFAAFDNAHREAICSKIGIQPRDIEAVMPCTSVQQGMIARTLHSQGEQYVNSMWFELLPETSLSKLKAAWMTVCKEHEMLRSGFVQTDDSKHPFALVTYTRQNFAFHWFEEEEEIPNISTVEQFARRPWNLSIGRNDDRAVIKFTAHHALYDAQSMQLILSDVAKAYSSKSLAPQSHINSLLGSILLHELNDVENKKLFWQRDENKIVVNRFPDLTPLRISESTHAVREIFSRIRTSDLEELCKQRGVTVQAAGQAAWARLLTAYTGESSNTFGMTLSGRSVHEEADSTPFPAIVTLPVSCNVNGTNEDLLSRTMNANALLHKYQFTPLTSIQRWAGFPEGNVFDTLFAYQKLRDNQEVTSRPWRVVREEANVDYAVSLEVQPTKSDDLALRLTFTESLIPARHAEILLKQFDSLLLDILENPDGACDVAPDIVAELLSITPAKDPILPGSVSLLHEFLEHGAHDSPEKNALEFATCLEPDNFQSQTWTYQEVNKESNKIAQLLCKRGIVPGQLIAICFDKCAEASFAIVGILKTGCAYVALDQNAPLERMSFILQDSGAKLILTAGKAAQKFKSMDKEIVDLDSSSILDGYPSDPPKLARYISPEDTCYCLYTSGTTGTPKGCLITHENAVQAMYSFQRLFSPHWTESSKWLQFASFHFDVSVLEQFWSWSVGICVASAPRDLIFEDIPGAIQRLGITHIDLTPSLARLVHPDEVPALCKGVFITGGEQLRQEILDVWGEHACIYNGYGPTEATIGCTMYPRVPQNGKPSNIGPQFDNVGSYVLKPNTALPVLRGGIGELCVSGKLVGKGYLNRPDLTTERFPILQHFNERVYRTGDLVRILHDGSFIFLGRADDQVKLRGQRLELSEINQVIKKSVEHLEEVVTLVLRHKAQQKEQLVTFFVSSSQDDENREFLISTMKEACKARLPGYMVPTHFIPIRAVPLNANNKADAKQLAAMYDIFSVDDLQKLSHSLQEKPWTAGETEILDILARVLDIEVSSLTKEVSIFELGLDSISIIGFSYALQTAGLSNAKISVIKSNPVMEKLVGALKNGDDSDSRMGNTILAASQGIAAFSQSHMIGICQQLGVESMDVESIAPCTPVQEGMIYRFLESQNALYFHSFDFRPEEGFDAKKLLSAWKRVVMRLDILRTKFVATDDGYAQVVMKSLDISEDQPRDYNATEKPIALQIPHSFSIISTPSENTISLRIFHGLYDGNSLNMMLRRIIDEYRGLENIEYGPSFHSSLQYGPLVKDPGAEKFWRDHLKNWVYHPMPTSAASEKDVVVTRIVEGIDGFEVLRRNLGVTHQAMIQAAWLSVLQGTLSPVLTIGMVTSGRTIDFDGADRVIGPLFNTLPFHVKIDSGMTASSLISRCHRFNMQMQDFQHTPLRDIQKWSPARPGQSLFGTLFVFLRPEVNDEDFAKDVWTQLEEEQTADYPLAFEATMNPGSSELRLTIIAQSSIVVESQATELLYQFEQTIRSILKQAGNNLISNNVTSPTGLDGNTHTINGTTSAGASELVEGGSKSSSFKWTKDTIQIRQEIASLAKVDEDKVYETSSVFELGLDSIDVIKLSSRLNKRGIAIPVSTIIKSQSIESMSANLSVNGKRAQQASVGRTVQEIGQDLTLYLKKNRKLPDNVEAVLPATPLQQSMVNEMIKSEYKRYFTVEAFEINEQVDDSRLIKAIEHTICRSPILRTTITEVEDPQSPVSYAQIVHKNGGALVNMTEEESLDDYVEQFKIKAAALAASGQRLCQVTCASVEKRQYLIMAVSHALYDGRSLRAFHEDIKSSYHGKFSSRPDPLPYLELVFQSNTDEAKKFWRSALSKLPAASFPRKDLSKLPNPSAVHRIERASSISLHNVERFCRSSRITLQTLGQTCWAIVLSYLMGQLDVVFGSVLACRDSEEAEEVMFPLMNTVAVRSVLHGTVIEMLGYMQDMSDTTRQYQHFPLGTAQAYALASRESGSSTKDIALFDTLFIYQGHRQAEESEPLYKSVYGSSDVELPVCVEMEIVDDSLFWTTACKSTARTSTEADQVITALDSVLQRIIISAQSPVISSDAEGISVCGLPKFRNPETIQKRKSGSSTTTNDQKWSDVELKIREVLHQISGVPLDGIQKSTTIFQIGLDSILVLKIPALLRQHCIKLSVSTILRAQTVRAMAESVLRADSDKHDFLDVDQILSKALSSVDVSSIVTNLESEIGEVQTVMPVTAGQKYMIRSWQASGRTLFCPTFEYTLSRPIDKTQLSTAWKDLLKRNEILRTGFVEIGSDILQVVFQDLHNEVNWRAPENRPARSGFADLRLPPVRLTVEDSKLKLEIHHVLYDGISLPLLIDQLQLLCRVQPLPAPELSFKNFVAQSLAASNKLQLQSSSTAKTLTRSKWESYLKQNTLHSSHGINDPAASQNARTEVFRPSLQVSPLKIIAQDSSVSVDALLLAAVSKIYARRLGQDHATSQVVFGIYLANRAPFGDDLSQLAAPTLNLLPLRVRDPLSRNLSEISQYIQKDLQEISSAEMSCASLADIYGWCGVQVDFFVNILKDNESGAAVSGMNGSKDGEAFVLDSTQNLSPRAEVMDVHHNEDFRTDNRHDAYLPSVDIEIRYQESNVDMGVFGPTNMVSIAEAEDMIRRFVGMWA